MKTIAAFLNTHPGGTLLIGVGEDENQKGVVRGNQEDDFDTDDKQSDTSSTLSIEISVICGLSM